MATREQEGNRHTGHTRKKVWYGSRHGSSHIGTEEFTRVIPNKVQPHTGSRQGAVRYGPERPTRIGR